MQINLTKKSKIYLRNKVRNFDLKHLSFNH